MRLYPRPQNQWPFQAVLLLTSLCWIGGSATAVNGQDRSAYVWVDTNARKTTVYLDSTRLGTAGPSLWTISPGRHRLRARPAGRYLWSFEYEETTIEVSPGDTVRVTFQFPYTYSIATRPPGATVFHVNADGRHSLGVTPLTHRTDEALRGTFVIDKMAFDSVHVNPGRQLWNSYRVELTGVGASGAAQHVELPSSQERQRWLTYTGAGLAVVAGGAAVYMQRRANRLRSSDDPHVRLRSSQYERLSNVSLVGMQVGVGILAFQLIWR
jgi:hypothetical protein